MTEFERDLRLLTPGQIKLAIIAITLLLAYAAVRSRYRTVRDWIRSIPFQWIEWQL